MAAVATAGPSCDHHGLSRLLIAADHLDIRGFHQDCPLFTAIEEVFPGGFDDVAHGLACNLVGRYADSLGSDERASWESLVEGDILRFDSLQYTKCSLIAVACCVIAQKFAGKRDWGCTTTFYVASHIFREDPQWTKKRKRTSSKDSGAYPFSRHDALKNFHSL